MNVNEGVNRNSVNKKRSDSLNVKYYEELLLLESNCVTIANWQLSCDMLLMIAVLSSKMPKTDICQVILRGLAPASRYLCVHLPNLFGT